MVFDVDGALYRQRPKRARMAAALIADAAIRCDVTNLRVLRAYRRTRETLAETETPGFEEKLLQTLTLQFGLQRHQVQSIARRWLEDRRLIWRPRFTQAWARYLRP